VATAAVLAVVHGSHEDTSTALGLRALAAETLDLAIAIDLVVLEDGEFGLLALVLDLLGGGVHLLLPLLGHTTTQAEDQVKGRLLLDVIVGKGAAILKLLSGEDETLLVRGNSLLVWVALAWCLRFSQSGAQRTLNLGLHIVDGVRRLHLKGDSLAREGLYEDLHGGLGVVSSARRENSTRNMGSKAQDPLRTCALHSPSVHVAGGGMRT
jgi:hypothetical protein